MTALVVTDDVEDKLQRPQWRPGSHPDHFSVSVRISHKFAHGFIRLCIDAILSALLVIYVLPLNFVKSRSRDIGSYNDYIALQFDRHLNSAAAEGPVKFQSDWKSLNPNRAASRLYEFLR